MVWVIRARNSASWVQIRCQEDVTSAILVPNADSSTRFPSRSEALEAADTLSAQQILPGVLLDLAPVELHRRSLVFPLMVWLFGVLAYVSLLKLLQWLLRRVWPAGANYSVMIIDGYVLLGPLVAIAALIQVTSPSETTARWFVPILVIGVIRIFELAVVQANDKFFDEYRHRRRYGPRVPYAVSGLHRTAILAMINYTEVVVWFAAFYAMKADQFSRPDIVSTASGALYYSVITIATVGYGDIAPTCPATRFLALCEVILGIFLAVVIFARVLSQLAAPLSMDEYES